MKRFLLTFAYGVILVFCFFFSPVIAFAEEALTAHEGEIALQQQEVFANVDTINQATQNPIAIHDESEVCGSSDTCNPQETHDETIVQADQNFEVRSEEIVTNIAGCESEAPYADAVSSLKDEEKRQSLQANTFEESLFRNTSQSQIIESGIYSFASALDNTKCLDVPGASTESGAALQIYTQNYTPAQFFNVTLLPNGFYSIVNVGSGLVLDVSGASTSNGTVVQQYYYNSTAAQQWRIIAAEAGFFKIVSALSDSCVLDVAGANPANGSIIQLYEDNGTDAQRWILRPTQIIADGFYVLKAGCSGKALDINSASLENGGNVQQCIENGTNAQVFQLAYSATDGYYTIANLGSGKVLDVKGAGSVAGTNVQQYEPNGTRAQKWALEENLDGTFTFHSSINGMVLDVHGASTSDWANIQVWHPNGTTAQKWFLTEVPDWLPEGAYTFLLTINSNNAFDVASGSTKTGANIQSYELNGTNAQRFYLRPTSNGYYTIQNTISGYYLNAESFCSRGNIVLGTAQHQFKPVFSAGGISFRLKDQTDLMLDVTYASTESGANIQLFAANGTPAQKFLLRPIGLFADGLYSIRYATNTNYVIDVPGATSYDVQLNLYEDNGTAAQRFFLQHVDINTYLIISACSGKNLQETLCPGEENQLWQSSPSSASGNQQWLVYLFADGNVQFAPTSNPNNRITLHTNTVENASPLEVCAHNETSSQKWKLISENESIVFDTLRITLRRMAELQKTSAYYSDYAVEDLVAILEPSSCDRMMFLDLRITTGITADQINSFVSSTSTGLSGTLQGLGDAFVVAAQQYGLNEVYLLAHAILESGWGTSALAKGYYFNGGEIDGIYYQAGTYYNFYGIGAYDSSPLSGGRKFAIINGWDSPEKAVIGAAQWIARYYVYSDAYAQPTLYAMKWDYARTNITNERGWHQYATDPFWPSSIARVINQCYSQIGESPKPAYIIPVYA